MDTVTAEILQTWWIQEFNCNVLQVMFLTIHPRLCSWECRNKMQLTHVCYVSQMTHCCHSASSSPLSDTSSPTKKEYPGQTPKCLHKLWEAWNVLQRTAILWILRTAINKRQEETFMRLFLHTSGTGWEVGKSSISNIFPCIGIILAAFQSPSNSCLGLMLKKPTHHLENDHII